MCQCIICDCIWWNYCGVCCGGIHEASFCWSYWCCKPDDLRLIDPACCHICDCDGFGYNCLYYGVICCAPKAVIEWSGLRTAGKTASHLNNQTVIIHNQSPIYMTHDMGHSTSPGSGSPYTGNPNAGYGSPGPNAYQGHQQMNMGMNAGPQGMNAKINF